MKCKERTHHYIINTVFFFFFFFSTFWGGCDAREVNIMIVFRIMPISGISVIAFYFPCQVFDTLTLEFTYRSSISQFQAVPRRRSHSSGGSNSSSGLVGSPSLAPHQVISSVPVTSLPHLLPALNSMTATSLPQMAPAAPPTASVQASGTSLVTAPVIAPSSSPAGSALLAQLLTSGLLRVTGL